MTTAHAQTIATCHRLNLPINLPTPSLKQMPHTLTLQFTLSVYFMLTFFFTARFTVGEHVEFNEFDEISPDTHKQVTAADGDTRFSFRARGHVTSAPPLIEGSCPAGVPPAAPIHGIEQPVWNEGGGSCFFIYLLFPAHVS